MSRAAKTHQLKVVCRPALTLDGFIADPNGECYSWINPKDEAVYEAALKQCGCELVGRKTYEQYIDMYAKRTDVMTFVYTRQYTFKDTDKIKFVHGDPQAVLQKIESYGLTELIHSGGGELNGMLADANLIDEIIVSIHPVVLGEGIPLFGSYKPRLKLELLSTVNEIDGIVKNHYRVVRWI